MPILTDLTVALPSLGLIGLGVAMVAAVGRDPQADRHDLSDYQAQTPQVIEGEIVAVHPSRRTWPVRAMEPPVRRRLRALPVDVDYPAGIVSGEIPAWRALLIDQAVPTLSDAAVREIADRWLREIAAEQQARTLAGAR